MKRFLMSLILTILLCGPAYAVTDQEIEDYIVRKALEVGFVKPGFPVGVIQVEGRLGKHKYRTGRHGLYWLPGGIHKDFIKKWRIDKWQVNCDVAVESLYKKMIKYDCSETKTLKKYNTTGYTYAYRNEIMLIKNQINKEYSDAHQRKAIQVTKVGAGRN